MTDSARPHKNGNAETLTSRGTFSSEKALDRASGVPIIPSLTFLESGSGLQKGSRK